MAGRVGCLLVALGDTVAAVVMVSSDFDGAIGAQQTASAKTRIWTSQPPVRAPHWAHEDVWPVLSHRPRRRDLRRAVDAADRAQPAPRVRELQRDPGGRAGTVAHAARRAARAARTLQHRRVGP